ncbi:MAG TPA: PKD domain-containing protein [Thermoanaerobaculia bacterium]
MNEAVRRLQLQQQIGELDAALAKEETGTFAGLWIQHQPEFRVIVQFTGPGAEERLKGRVAGGPLANLVEARRVRFSLEDLEKRQETSRARSRAAGVPFNSDIDVPANRVELHVTEPEKLQAKLAAAGAHLPEGVVVKRVPRLAQSETKITGGVALSTCTAGFTVRHNTSGELGVSTAAHCGNTQAYQGVNLPFRLEDNNTDQDVQWHSACDIFEVTNEFDSGIGIRAVVGTIPRDNQAIGSVVCKNGMTTGHTCGTISSKTFDLGANHNATFIRMNNYPSANLSEAGDSGGPWFVDNYAYGTHFGAPGDDANDSIYMAINYISSLGVSVLTSNPGNCNRRPTANFTYTVNGNYVDFDASSSSDPDGTIVSYEWDFGTGYTHTTNSPYTYEYYPTRSTYAVTLTVTDNEGAVAERTQLVSLCGTRFCVE